MSAIIYSGSNTFVPSMEAAGNLIVNYSRNPNSFPVNQYIGIRKVEKDFGYYAVIDPDEAARVVNSQDYIWPDGNDEPKGVLNTNEHSFLEYRTSRYAYPFALGFKAVQQASWEILAQHAATEAAKAMTHRTVLVQSALANASWGSNTDTATSLGGGTWATSSSTDLHIKKTLLAAAQVINKATNGVVRPESLQLVIPSSLATVMSETEEIHSYVKSSPYAMEFLDGRNLIGQWGLPAVLYGFKIVIEDAVRVTSRKGASRTADFVQANNVAYLIGRPEGLDAGLGTGRTFNTVTLLAYEEFTVESKTDVDNRRYEGRVVQDIAAVVTAAASGFKITGCQ